MTYLILLKLLSSLTLIYFIDLCKTPSLLKSKVSSMSKPISLAKAILNDPAVDLQATPLLKTFLVDLRKKSLICHPPSLTCQQMIANLSRAADHYESHAKR